MKQPAALALFVLVFLACADEGRTPAGSGPVSSPTRAAEPADRRAASVEDAWDEAQIRGVDFRAVGPESSWVLEIDEGKGVLFTLRGQPYAFPGADLTLETSLPEWVYTTTSGGRQLVVRIVGGACNVAGGPGGTARVTVTLDGAAYEGCGRGID